MASNHTPDYTPRSPDLTPHPAAFSDEAIEVIRAKLGSCRWVLDPFAGTGKIHTLRPEFITWGLELEPEWAKWSPWTEVGDALDTGLPDGSFDAVATSPAYGNRMADHHDAKDGTRRITYKHYLGRDLSDGNSGVLQWGDQYREFHIKAWQEAARVVKPGGRLLVVVADHIRSGRRMMVTDWHRGAIETHAPFTFLEQVVIEKKGMRFGANRDVRIEHESVLVFVRELGPNGGYPSGSADSWEVE